MLHKVLYSILISLIPFSVSFLPIQKASAQITPDNTLGTESSVVNQLNQLKSLIEGGAVRGENLFHSFQEFNVGNGQSVYFVNPEGVNNILTRVTGDNMSQILGTLGVNGNANLFLLNPNGFIFGPNAKLDLNGSFTATTGDIQLGEDGVFSATDIEGSSLLSVKPEALFANFQGQIENRANLVVRDGQNIILMADKVVNTGNLTAPGGMIKLQGNEVVISGNAVVDVSGDEGAGACCEADPFGIAVQGIDEVNIGENVSLRADALVSGDGGAIEISSQGRVEFLGNISAKGENPGTVTIDAPTVINNGVIDLGLENSESEAEKVSETEDDNEIASNSDIDTEKTITSDNESEKVIASSNESENKIASEGKIENVNEIASNSNTESQKEIASNSDNDSENMISSQKQTQEQNVGADSIPSSQNQILTTNNPRLQPDETLGNENTQIEAIDENNDRVIGGAERGVNLFHSFLEFNVENNKGVYFANPDGIENILSRVTGNNISEIRGTLGVEGSANLYFINPNGLLFNENARLDLNGSFFASTAEAIAFNNFEYSAVNPNLPPNLVVSVPTGLRFGDNPGDITNQGTLITPNDLTLEAENLNLSSIIAAEGNLTLKAQNTVTIRDSQENPFLAASGEDLLIQGHQIDIFALNHPDSGLFSGGDLILRSPNPVIGDAHYWSGGNFQIEQIDGSNGDLNSIQDPIIRAAGDVSFNIYQGTSLHIIAGGSVNAGTIFITGVETGTEGIDFIQEAITLSDGTVINIDGSQQATVDIRAGVKSEAIGTPRITGLDASDFLIPIPNVNEAATSSDITVGDVVNFTGNGLVFLTNQYKPNSTVTGGDISITGNIFFGFGVEVIGDVVVDSRNNINIDGQNFGVGIYSYGGDIILKSKNEITLTNGALIDTRDYNLAGSSGNIDIVTGGLSLNNQSLLVTNNFPGTGETNAGNINITATGNISLSGLSGILSDLSSGTKGIAGNVIIKASSIYLNEGSQISSSLFRGNNIYPGAEGKAGDISITATDSINIAGYNQLFGYSSGLFSSAEFSSTGLAGNITIKTNELKVTDGALVNSSSFNSDNAGNINVEANTVEVLRGGQIQSLIRGVGGGNAGIITINAKEQILIEGSDSNYNDRLTEFGPIIVNNVTSSSGIFSGVLATSGNGGDQILETKNLILNDRGRLDTESFGGNGGNITIKADLVEIKSKGSIFTDVNSGATGNAGNIKIEARQFKLEENSFISASTDSEGNAGNIEIKNSELIKISDSSSLQSNVDTDATGNGGDITLSAKNIILSSKSTIMSDTEGTGNGGNVIIQDAELVQIDNEGFITANTESAGNAGDININAQTLSMTDGFIEVTSSGDGNVGSIEINSSDSVILNNSSLFAQVLEEGTGNGGFITINTDKLSLTEGSAISISTFGDAEGGKITINASESVEVISGDSISSIIAANLGAEIGGDITVTTKTLRVDNALISTFISGTGDGGDLIINASELVTVKGGQGKIDTAVEESATGNGGDLNITTQKLTIENGAQVSTGTFGDGNSGKLSINSTDLVTVNGLGSGIFTQTEGKGNANDLTIETQQLTLENGGQISASTISEGKAGNIDIDASDLVLLTGNKSSILSKTEGSGDGGNVVITTNDFSAFAQAKVSVSTNASGNGGNINLSATNLNLDSAIIEALTTGVGNPGSILITNGDNNANQVTLTNSTISTEIQADGEGSTPANITINTDNLTLDASTITASTSANRDAGNITIPDAQEISLINQSEISALTTGEGKAGNINFVVENQINLESGSILNVETQEEGDAGDIEITADTITIGEDAELSARTTEQAIGKAGNITLNANQVNISGELGIFAETEGVADAGNLTINPHNEVNLNIVFTDEGTISASTFGNGDGGDIEIAASDTINLTGNGSIKVETSGSGNAGSISIDSNQLNINNGVEISASTSSAGDSGNITLDAANLNLDGANISALTRGAGNPGSILITNGDNNANQVTLTNSTISTEIQADGEANTLSNITIKTDNLKSENSTITASTSGKGNAGNITIPNAQQINLTNSRIIATTSGEGDTGEINLTATDKINLTNDSEISSSVETGGRGNSLSVNLSTPELELNQSQINAFTDGIGDAGSINIDNQGNNNNQVKLTNQSQISTEIRDNGQATQPSNININTQRLTLSNDSKITASTSGQGDTGEINLTATDFINLSHESEISSAINQGGRGNSEQITLNTPLLSLTGGSNISAATAGEGNAGTITIPKALEVFLDGSSSISTAIEASGIATQPSNIFINTQRLTLSNNGRITASTSGQGNTGRIDLNATESINLSSGSGISSAVEAGGVGNSEQITLNTPLLSLTGGSNISAATAGAGNAGTITIPKALEVFLDGSSSISTAIEASGIANLPSNIFINTQRLTLSNNGRITASTSGQGNTGRIDLNATESINLSSGSGISSAVEAGGVGNSEQITLNTPLLSLTGGSNISAATAGAGNAGTITIPKALEVFLDESSSISTAIEASGIANLPSNIFINTQRLTLSNNSEITASTSGKGNAGNITIPNAQEINLTNSRILATTSGEGDTGKIDLTATEKINLADESEISSSVKIGGIGDSDQITLNTSQLQLTNNAKISAATAGIGNAGQITIQNANTVLIDTNSTISTAILQGGVAQQPANITINTNTLTLDNSAEITASAAGEGEGGNITINTNTPLTLNNQARITSALDETGIGKGGNITINAPSLFLDNQSEINASTFGMGEGGFVRLIIDNQINLDNASVIATAVEPTAIGIGGRIEIDTQQVNLDNQSQLRASTLGQGNADSITIRANTVELINGSNISTETNSEFDAGNITLILSESLFISGEGSGLFANTELNSSGDGGNITINSPLINLEDNAAIAVSSLGEGIGRDINITANTLNLDNSDITAQTRSTDGGNITLNLQGPLTLILNNGSNITATAGTAQAGGDGGNIVINSPFILSVPSNPFNTITANAFEGDGGNIEITTNAIFGGEFLIIDASSQFGLDGEVIINDPDVDPTSGLIIIEANFVDAESLIARNPCAFEGEQIAGGSSFVVTGQGGLPASFEETISNDYWLLEWTSPEEEVEERSQRHPLDFRERSTQIDKSVVEEWLVNTQGEIVLAVDRTIKVTSYSPNLLHLSCGNNIDLKTKSN